MKKILEFLGLFIVIYVAFMIPSLITDYIGDMSITPIYCQDSDKSEDYGNAGCIVYSKFLYTGPLWLSFLISLSIVCCSGIDENTDKVTDLDISDYT